MPDALATLANAAGKVTRLGLQITGRGATALPGLVTLQLDPNYIAAITRGLPHGVALISGTNGKTTTARMLSDIARAAGWTPIHNRSGSNLERGIAGALLADSSWRGQSRGDVGLFEVDEASLPRVLKGLAPRVVTIPNLFRDQLDRYFEIDALARRIGDAVALLDPATIVVLNADDPIVASLGMRHRGRVLYFGVDDPSVGGQVPQSISDATRCPRCKSPLRYERIVLAHVGVWSCASCGLARPARDVSASRIRLDASSSEIEIRLPVASAFDPVRVPLPGLYNSYNALAAITSARALDIALPTAARAIATFRPAFGRLEQIAVDGRTLRLILVKNPAGFNAAIGALLETGRTPRLLAALNDQYADGRDVSWIWDADFESLAAAIAHVVVTGIRSRDLANRFKYAGVPLERIEVVDAWAGAIDRAVGATPVGEELVVVATYTAMQSLRAELARRGHVAPFWED
ncbi:MAG TPA: MurT ligase domain-containing protein [Candidatus Limnocylindrales bacterium]|nr:MurT ligase domain-containing protein [Candidatus Limnocylindrales bacterium]